MNKRFLSLLMASTLLLTAAGCGEAGNNTEQKDDKPAKDTDDGVVIDYAALTAAATPSPAPLPDFAPEPEDAPEEQALVAEAQTWLCNEMTLVSTVEYQKPAHEAELDLILTKGDTKLTVPGFWDGDRIWRVRFALPEEGQWAYETVCTNPADTGLHGIKGTVNCTAYTGDLAIYKHGFVTTKPDTKYFVYADGTPFLYIGDTHWNYLTEEYDSAGKRNAGIETDSHFKYIVNKRVAQGYTVYQTEPISAPVSCGDGISKADIKGFKTMDKYYRYIAAMGLVHANAEFFFPSDMPTMCRSKKYEENMRVSARYWVARFGAYPVMWTLGQEIDQEAYFVDTISGTKGAVKSTYTEYPYITLAKYLHQFDAYQHPLSGHQQGTRAFGNGTTASNSSFRDVEGHSWWATQYKPVLNEKVDFTAPFDYWMNGQGKPAVMYESCYDHLWTNEYGARAEGWIALLNGMFGYGYGCEDMWLYRSTYDTDKPTTRNGITITVEEKAALWGDAIEFPAGYQVGYMGQFLQKFEWWRLEPVFGNAEQFKPDNTNYAISRIGQELYIAYFYQPEKNTGTFTGLDKTAAYEFYWFNPRTTATSTPKTVVRDEDGKFAVGDRPSAEDWVLVIQKKNA